jgi:hypothetical protein
MEYNNEQEIPTHDIDYMDSRLADPIQHASLEQMAEASRSRANLHDHLLIAAATYDKADHRHPLTASHAAAQAALYMQARASLIANYNSPYVAAREAEAERWISRSFEALEPDDDERRRDMQAVATRAHEGAMYTFRAIRDGQGSDSDTARLHAFQQGNELAEAHHHLHDMWDPRATELAGTWAISEYLHGNTRRARELGRMGLWRAATTEETLLGVDHSLLRGRLHAGRSFRQFARAIGSSAFTSIAASISQQEAESTPPPAESDETRKKITKAQKLLIPR